MRYMISNFMQQLHNGILLIVCVCLFGILFSTLSQPSYAVSTPKQALTEIRSDQSTQSPEEAYEEAAEVIDDPKMGVEKEYEQNIDKYFQEHPEEGGLIESAKELINQVTGGDQ
ncbi:MAG: hypothetical protein HC769_04035 [Cyanobacteria bacterium CRU_2_1]|nr:hypothetical protein [Cyanobacteria bacterium RU_5_0]NJR58088.1 hypothetical protein [Cyanobacteria bacterium CRU_2_1]